MEASTNKSKFVDELGKVLAHLYDPHYLSRSMLIDLFDLAGRKDAADALRRILVDAIARLKPDAEVPSNSNAWRFYQILNFRFIEQFTQREVAEDLMFSTRQLRRQEAIAQVVLADYLWAHNDLNKHASLLGQTIDKDLEADEGAQLADREIELARLARVTPTESIALSDIISKVARMLNPLVRASGVSLRSQVPENLPLLAVQESAARQAFVHLTTLAARCVPGGRVQITAEVAPDSRDAQIMIEALRAVVVNVRQLDESDLNLAKQLIEVAGGTLTCHLDEKAAAPFVAQLHLPVAGSIPVLVVDDNPDILALFARYLEGTRYRFMGTGDPKAALDLAVENNVSAAILDVMLPGMDGWELLSQLREHPRLERVPLLISTILPYGEMAAALGAAEFLPKPVSREALLAALDRQVRHRPSGSR